MKYHPIYVNSAYDDLFYFHYFVTYRCNKGNIKTCLGFNKNMISGFGVYLGSCDVQDTQQKIVVAISWIMIIIFYIYLDYILWFSFTKDLLDLYLETSKNLNKQIFYDGNNFKLWDYSSSRMSRKTKTYLFIEGTGGR